MITFAVDYLTLLQGLPEGLKPEAPGLVSPCDTVTRYIRADAPRLWLVGLFFSYLKYECHFLSLHPLQSFNNLKH
jgi:hypothetical protein